LDEAAEGARNAEAHVIEQNDHDIGRAVRSAQRGLRWGGRVSGIERDRATIGLIGNRKNLASNVRILSHGLLLSSGLVELRRRYDSHDASITIFRGSGASTSRIAWKKHRRADRARSQGQELCHLNSVVPASDKAGDRITRADDARLNHR